MLREIGRRLKNLREERGLTLAHIAAQTKLSKAYLSELEHGNATNPTLDALKRLADAFGVTVADVVGLPAATATSTVPPELPDGLRQFIRHRRLHGKPLDHATINWLANAQFRGATRPATLEDYAHLHRSLVLDSEDA